jgi:hypothetical protein
MFSAKHVNLFQDLKYYFNNNNKTIKALNKNASSFLNKLQNATTMFRLLLSFLSVETFLIRKITYLTKRINLYYRPTFSRARSLTWSTTTARGRRPSRTPSSGSSTRRSARYRWTVQVINRNLFRFVFCKSCFNDRGSARRMTLSRKYSFG